MTPVSPTCSPPRARWQRLGSARHARITARDGQFFPFFGGGGKVVLRSVKVRLCDVPFERELNLDSTAKRGTHCHSSSIHSLGIKYSANQIDIIRDIASQSDRANQTDSNVLSRFHPRGCMGYHLRPALVLLARQETAPREGAVGCGLPRVWSLLSAVRPLASPLRFCIWGSPTPLPAPAPRLAGPPTRSGRAQFTPSPGRPPLLPLRARRGRARLCAAGREGAQRRGLVSAPRCPPRRSLVLPAPLTDHRRRPQHTLPLGHLEQRRHPHRRARAQLPSLAVPLPVCVRHDHRRHPHR